MKKIIRIITRLNIGGPAIHVVLLSSSLNTRGYEDILVCGKVSQAEGDMGYLAREKGVYPLVVEELGRDISFWNDLKSFFRLFRIIRKEKPYIVHTHMAKAGTLGRLAAIFAGVPVKIHTFHGHVFDGYFSPLKTRVFILIEALLSHFTDKYIIVSQAVKDELVNNLKVINGDKGVVMPLGLELDRFLKCDLKKGAFRRGVGADRDALLVGIVGRLVPIKNHMMFLDVVKKVKDRAGALKVMFLVIGDGESRGALEEYVKSNNLGGMVKFTGWIEDLVPVYADLDVVCLTSLNEGTPVSIIEAMAAGRAVIATDVGGVRDLVVDGLSGSLVASNDAETFSDRLMWLLKDPARRNSFGAYGQNIVIEKYSKERLVRNITTLYEECLQKS